MMRALAEISRTRAFRARMLAGAALAALAAPAALVALTTSAAAQETWNNPATVPGPVPGTFDYSDDANWTPATVPAGTAFFGATSTPNISFSADTTIGGWTFNPGAAAYTFSNSFELRFLGAGIAINGGSASITNNGLLEFHNVSTAGSATITNDFDLDFFDASTAGNASILNTCCMAFFDASTAGRATITNFGDLSFNQSSTAGAANIENNGSLEFFDGSTAARATITNNGFLSFVDTSTAGNASITNTGVLLFAGDSTAGNASITNNFGINFEDAHGRQRDHYDQRRNRLFL